MTRGWTEHSGRALELAMENVDTDQIIPARFMSTPRSEGYAKYLFHDLRRDADGALLSTFPLNDHADATILITQRNFGTGSSREAAVYALAAAGIRVIIAPSFGDIFAGNAVNNGVLPATVNEADIDALTASMAGQNADLIVSLETLTISCNSVRVPFALSDTWSLKLKNGWDDIDLTLQHTPEIQRFKEVRREEHPRAWPDVAR